MIHSLGERLRIRTMVHVAGEPIPYFWPMRTFIHHNPLHGLEHTPFAEAVAEGKRLFRARGYLPRAAHQRYLTNGTVDPQALEHQVSKFLAGEKPQEGLDMHRLLMTVLGACQQPVSMKLTLANAQDVYAMLHGHALPPREIPLPLLASLVKSEVPTHAPLYAGVDTLFGTEISSILNELVIKSCLDFFDEGQSVWQMPGRDKGLFSSWSAIARRNLRLFIRGLHVKQILEVDDTPEGMIRYVMNELGIPEDLWMDYFTSELTQLHGWAGFIRWRSSAKHYYWNRHYPADLVDYLAIRLVLSLALLREHAQRARTPDTALALSRFVEAQPAEAFLRHEFHSRQVLPELAMAVEDALATRRENHIARLLPDYLIRKREDEARRQASALHDLAEKANFSGALLQATPDELSRLLDMLSRFENQEGQVWLHAEEAHYMNRLIHGLNISPPAAHEKRPFAQAMFCIDVRSERIRRHLEKVGDYQTYGIAGFFGIPVGFIGLDKGSETHLCPVVVKPKNLVLELAIARSTEDQAFVSVVEQIIHELKTSVLSPFITVEAIGLLFGFDMFGKSLAPLAYNRWRSRLHPERPDTRLLLDKLTREQADSIIRSLQRSMIVKAVGRELGIQRERLTDDMIRELRETALETREGPTEFARHFKLDETLETRFIERLKNIYRINQGYAQIQLERLGRIGFTFDEQAHFVSQALRSIGLTEGFSRFVLLAGHGSTSENNPYESALDCGACGGNHGLINARIIAQIANKPAIRERLRAQNILIPDDTWFIPAFHNTTTDELRLHDLDLLPPSYLVYMERLNNELQAASRLCAAERMQALEPVALPDDAVHAYRLARRNAMDWSQVRPEWGLARNAAFVIGRRHITGLLNLEGRVFLHSYDHHLDPRGRLLENILAGPLVVGQWINMEHYFSVVDNEHYGSGSKAYHNIAGRFGVMTGNLSDLRTGLPSQTVLRNGEPYHEPMRLLTLIEAPFAHARTAVENVAKVKNLVHNGWLRMVIVDPEQGIFYRFEDGKWHQHPMPEPSPTPAIKEMLT